MRYLPRLLCCSLLGACSDLSLNAKGAAEDAGTNETGHGADMDTATDSAVDASWYAPAAALSVVDGAAVTADAAVRLRLADADRTDLECDLVLPVDDLVVTTSPAAAIAFWWELAISIAGASECARMSLPVQIGLGIGPLDPEVRARLGTVGREDEADGMYGAFARIDGGEVIAIGYAAPEDTSLEATDPPVDGDYELEPVFLLPAPD